MAVHTDLVVFALIVAAFADPPIELLAIRRVNPYDIAVEAVSANQSVEHDWDRDWMSRVIQEGVIESERELNCSFPRYCRTEDGRPSTALSEDRRIRLLRIPVWDVVARWREAIL